MSIQLACTNPDCRKTMEVGDEMAGMKFKCPSCKTVVGVPKTASNPSAAPFGGFEMTMPDSEPAKPGSKPSPAKEPARPVPAASIPSIPSISGTSPAKEPEKPPTAPENDANAAIYAIDAFLDGKRGKRTPFDVEKEIAHGGMGAVLLAQDKAIQRELAVKVMRRQIADSEEHRLRFLEEAQVTGQLEHPNIVPIHDLGKDAEGNLYFTMKLVKGRSLGQILKEMKAGEGSGFGVQGSGTAGKEGSGFGVQGSGTAGKEGSGLGVQGSGERPEDSGEKSEKPGSTPPTTHHSPLTRDHSPLTRDHSPLTLSDLLGVFLKVCDAIAFAHSKSVIHRT